jgi:protein-L-isoaspartate O-methyltransferase
VVLLTWEDYAARLAEQATQPSSRWRPLVAAVPRHVFVPRWWTATRDGWIRRNGPGMEGEKWAELVYQDQSLITQIASLHADHATKDDRPEGQPTSSSTLPGLVVTMYRHAMISDGMDVLDIGTGSGYGAALLTARLGAEHVTSIDIEEYLVSAATERLASIAMKPLVETCDATGPLPGGPASYDRIVSMTSVSPVPARWLAALRPGGRLVTTLAGTGLLVTATKTPEGGAAGRTEWDRAGFMEARTGPEYPPGLLRIIPGALDGDGDTSNGRYPIVNIGWAWELSSMLGITIPGIKHHYEKAENGQRTAWLLHPDGSWARATAAADEPPVVHQGGPRRLWDTADQIRHAWLTDGGLPAYGADVIITPDGTITLRRGHWKAVIPAAAP